MQISRNSDYQNNLTISHIPRCYVEFLSHNIIYQDIDKSMALCVIDLSKNKETAGNAWRLSIILFIIIVRFHELHIELSKESD